MVRSSTGLKKAPGVLSCVCAHSPTHVYIEIAMKVMIAHQT